MNKRDRTKALIRYYRTLNPAATGDWNVLKEISKDIHDYLEVFSYEDLKDESTSYESDELYNETY